MEGRGVSRRNFLKLRGAALVVGSLDFPFRMLTGVESIDNPLQMYVERGWEKVYRDQYSYTDTFTFICAPNDTHQCRLRAFVRNGVVIRIEQNYDGDRYGDPKGNRSTVAWNPRGCPKGYTMHRRLYGPYRLKGPMVRSGWKAWADDGFPSLSDDPSLRDRYKFNSRGDDDFVPLSWEEANRYTAAGLHAIAETYSGEEGRRRLIEQDGYPEEMLEFWEEAGVRTIKMGSSLPLHGIAGKFALFRFANGLSLVDAAVHIGLPLCQRCANLQK